MDTRQQVAPGDLAVLLTDWSRHLRARNLSPRTIASYAATGEECRHWLARMRLSELTGLGVDDLDFDADVAHVLGKGRRARAVPFGNKT
jgi:integrase